MSHILTFAAGFLCGGAALWAALAWIAGAAAFHS